jgi:hypothetical protein
MSLLIPPSRRFAKVLRVEAKAFLQRQNAFVALVIDAISSIPANLLPTGTLLLEDFRAADDSDGYLRFLEGVDGEINVLVEVASWRRSGWFGRRWYEVKANDALPEGLFQEAWNLLQTGSGLDRYQQLSADEMPDGHLVKLAKLFVGRKVIGTTPGGRIHLQ